MRFHNIRSLLLSSWTLSLLVQIATAVFAILVVQSSSRLALCICAAIGIGIGWCVLRALQAGFNATESTIVWSSIVGRTEEASVSVSLFLEPVGVTGKYYRIVVDNIPWYRQPLYVSTVGEWRVVLAAGGRTATVSELPVRSVAKFLLGRREAKRTRRR
jgi:hypothetical protein